MLDKLEQVERDYRRTSGGRLSKLRYDADPFTRSIRESMMTRNFHLSNHLEVYNGIGDPDAFVRKYKGALKLKGTEDVAFCKCFKVALGGQSLVSTTHSS